MVKRYEPDTEYAKGRAWMTEHYCGEWVSLDDYAALAKRCERLEAALRYVHSHISGVRLAIDECNDVLGGVP